MQMRGSSVSLFSLPARWGVGAWRAGSCLGECQHKCELGRAAVVHVVRHCMVPANTTLASPVNTSVAAVIPTHQADLPPRLTLQHKCELGVRHTSHNIASLRPSV